MTRSRRSRTFCLDRPRTIRDIVQMFHDPYVHEDFVVVQGTIEGLKGVGICPGNTGIRLGKKPGAGT